MGVITSCLAPNSWLGTGWGSGGGLEVKGHDLALPEHDLGMSTRGLDSAGDNGECGDLANGLQLMSSRAHLFL